MSFQNGAHMSTLSLIRIAKILCVHIIFLCFTSLHFTSLRFVHGGFSFCSPCVLCILSIRSISLWLHGMHRSERKHDWVCQLWMSLMLEAAGIFNSILLLDVSAFRCGWMCMRLISSIVWLFLYLFFSSLCRSVCHMFRSINNFFSACKHPNTHTQPQP